MKFNHDMVLQVREFLERYKDIHEIAAKMKIDPYTVQAIVDFINNIVT